eukprot:GHRR01037821.1.p1 GENE.GHRR01037821.1~~GHRR01037821.1.p1  ORF type:complete len:124 (-),score=27.80 GHRR01037821.1:193-564(-)
MQHTLLALSTICRCIMSCFVLLHWACRILGMVDGAVLLVDAVEGPLAQTKFVLAKALSRGLAPVVVLNKVDRPAATQSRCDTVASQLFDLFASLGATDEQLDFPLLYASAKQVGYWSRCMLCR